MVMVVGVDVIVILLVSQVLLVTQLAVETGVSFLLCQNTKRQWSKLDIRDADSLAQTKERKSKISSGYHIRSLCHVRIMRLMAIIMVLSQGQDYRSQTHI